MRTLPIALALALLIAAACADNLPDAPRNTPTNQATELSAAASRLQGWQNRLTNAHLEIHSQVHTTEPPIEVEAVALLTPDLFYYSLHSLFGDEPGAPRSRIESLSTGGAAYSRWYGVDGWLRLPLDRWTHDAGFTAGLEAVANLSWAQLDDVQITRGEWQGRPIWLVEYEADRVDLFQYPDLISPLATGLNGAPTVLFSYDSLRAVVRLSIDRESGAPLLTETRQWFDGSGGEDETEIASTITLRAWNAPLDLPSPQPVLAPDEYWAQIAAARSEEPALRRSSATPLQLIALTQDWLRAEDAQLAQDTLVTVGERQYAARRMIDSEAGEFLSLLTPLAGYIGESGGRSGSGIPLMKWFTVRPKRAALAGLQDEATALVEAQLAEIADPLPEIEAVAWLEVTLRLNDVSGAWIEAVLNADLITADGVLKLKSVIAADPTR